MARKADTPSEGRRITQFSTTSPNTSIIESDPLSETIEQLNQQIEQNKVLKKRNGIFSAKISELEEQIRSKDEELAVLKHRAQMEKIFKAMEESVLSNITTTLTRLQDLRTDNGLPRNKQFDKVIDLINFKHQSTEVHHSNNRNTNRLIEVRENSHKEKLHKEKQQKEKLHEEKNSSHINKKSTSDIPIFFRKGRTETLMSERLQSLMAQLDSEEDEDMIIHLLASCTNESNNNARKNENDEEEEEEEVLEEEEEEDEVKEEGVEKVSDNEFRHIFENRSELVSSWLEKNENLTNEEAEEEIEKKEKQGDIYYKDQSFQLPNYIANNTSNETNRRAISSPEPKDLVNSVLHPITPENKPTQEQPKQPKQKKQTKQTNNEDAVNEKGIQQEDFKLKEETKEGILVAQDKPTQRYTRAKKEVNYKPLSINAKIRRDSIHMKDAVGEGVLYHAAEPKQTCNKKRQPLRNVTNTQQQDQSLSKQVSKKRPKKIDNGELSIFDFNSEETHTTRRSKRQKS